jgi:hypothetical protein
LIQHNQSLNIMWDSGEEATGGWEMTIKDILDAPNNSSAVAYIRPTTCTPVY